MCAQCNLFGRNGEVTTELGGWGRYPRCCSTLLTADSVASVRALQRDLEGYVARGAGRAYGDAGVGLPSTIAMRSLDRMRHFDPASGVLTVEAGVTLKDVIDALLPRGWFVPVVPGTSFVTVGGMVAADVHGKNHHRCGGFGHHVISLVLLAPSGEALTCSPSENAELFKATIGGMGLTGIIVEVTFRMIRVETGWIRQSTRATSDLDATLTALTEGDAQSTYSVAWIDVSPGRKRLGRGVVFLGEHALRTELTQASPAFPPSRRPSHSVPVDLPRGALNRWSVAAFNAIYHGKAAARPGTTLVRWDKYFFPLDAIGDWNRLYGRGGFLQHQCVIPVAAAAKTIANILDRVAAAGCAPFLAVVKSLGPGGGLLSFPMPGLTLALDLAVSPRVFTLLDELDRAVVGVGGRLYLAKDARQSIDTFRAGYPKLLDFEAARRAIGAHRRVRSHLSARLGII